MTRAGVAEVSETIEPPYESTSSTEECSRYNVLESCVIQTTPVPETGRLDVLVRLTSPQNGTQPGRGAAYAHAALDARHDGIPQTFRGVTYRVNVHIAAAELGHTGALYGIPFLGDGEAYVSVAARPQECRDCFTSSTVTLLDKGRGPITMSGVDFSIPLTLPDCYTIPGQPPPGIVWVETEIGVRQSLGVPGVDTGQAIASVQATVTSVTVEESDPSYSCAF